MEVSLHIVRGFEKDKKFTFKNPDILVAGRSSDSKIKFEQNDPYISRNHFLLEIAPPNCMIRHLSKTNQTFVNDKPINEKLLEHNDIIQVGYTLIKVKIVYKVDVVEKKCKKCDNTFTVRDNFEEDQLCESCLHDMPHISIAPIKKGNVVYCSICNKNLTLIADNDGRKDELYGKVKYICPDCIKPVDFLKGEKIDKYEKIQFLAQGGMGEVFLVYERNTSRILVLKRILGLADNTIIKKHFEREIIVHQKLNYPNIIHYIDTGVHEGEPFIVMEYADGDNLDAYIEKHNGKVPLKQALQIFIQAVEGIKYLHQLNPPVLHRDIKPANIILQKTGERLVSKIADFGLSKPFSDAGGLSFTRIGEMKGSKMFMAPQQVRDTKNVNLDCDIYSLGVTAYYLFTGKLPYEYPSILEQKKIKTKYRNKRERIQSELNNLGGGNNLLSLILTGSIIPIEQKANNIPKSIGTIINRMINTKIKDYNASSVLSDLKKVFEKSI